MNRRGFFGLFTGAAAAFALDPERALWVPGAKLISVPAAAIVSSYSVGWYSAGFNKALIGHTVQFRRPRPFIPYDTEPLFVYDTYILLPDGPKLLTA